jgi:integrase
MPVPRKYPGPNGTEVTKYLVYYVNLEGKRTSKTFATQSQAKAFEKKVALDKPKKAAKLTKSDLTFEDAFDKFIADSEAGRDGNPPWRYQTVQNHKAIARIIYAFLDKDSKLKTLTVADLKAVRASIQQSPYADSTKRSMWVMLKSVLSYMVTEEIISHNPAQTLTMRFSKNAVIEEEPFEVFSKKEVQLIVAKAKELRAHRLPSVRESFERLWILPALLFETGMRISEALALEWRAVDLKERTITIRQTFNRKNQLDTVKALASRRTITLSKAMAMVLSDMQWQAKGDFVVSGQDGQPLQYRNTLRWWHRLLDEAGVREGGFHKARHFYASCLIEQGVDAKVLSTNMGHSDVNFTMNVYGHLFDDRDTRDKKREVADALSVLAA